MKYLYYDKYQEQEEAKMSNIGGFVNYFVNEHTDKLFSEKYPLQKDIHLVENDGGKT